MAVIRSLTWCVKVCSQPSTWPGGHQPAKAWLGDQDAPETLLGGVTGTVAELQLVQPLQVERQAAAVAIQLDP